MIKRTKENIDSAIVSKGNNIVNKLQQGYILTDETLCTFNSLMIFKELFDNKCKMLDAALENLYYIADRLIPCDGGDEPTPSDVYYNIFVSSNKSNARYYINNVERSSASYPKGTRNIQVKATCSGYYDKTFVIDELLRDYNINFEFTQDDIRPQDKYSVTVDCNVSGATIEINGQIRSYAVFDAGTRVTVRAYKTGYTTFETTIQSLNNDEIIHAIIQEDTSANVTLTVNTSPSNANVVIYDKTTGLSYNTKQKTFTRGTIVKIVTTLEGYNDDVRDNIVLNSDKTINIQLVQQEEEKYTVVVNTIPNEASAVITDLDTANYWLELEKLYKKRIEELDKLVLKPDSEPYEFWMKANDIRISDINYQKQNWNNFNIKPKISIIVPLYNTPIKFFKELLFTIYNQTYPNWELCLADGSPERLTEIESICKDSRIKYKYIGENKGISGNSNEALSLATGEFIALLDHDDLLPLNSLYEIVKCINENKDVEFIYTDEDKIESIDKPRYDPHFKPDYAPDFLMSGNYICHFSVFKKELMDKLQGFRSKYDGAQDYDIILRATELTTKIKHISKILYHWRIHPGSTAGNSEAKLYAYEAGEKALQDHLIRIGSNGIAKRDEKINGFYSILYPVTGNPKVNILIANRNNVYYLKNCLKSIFENTTYSNYEIDIIDNNSDDLETLKYYEEIAKNKKIKIIKYNEKLAKNNNYLGYANYSKLINFAMKKIDGEFIVELDRHEKINTNNWLEIMLGIARRKEVGCVGSKVYYSNGTIKHAGIVYGIGDYAVYLYRETYNGHRVRDKMICNMSIVSSLCRMYRKEIFEEVNGMNEDINFELINETDFSLKIRQKGYLNIYTPQVEIND